MKVSQQRIRQLLAIFLLTLPCTGCVRRRLLVRTNPPGALVSVDNQVIGTSPAASSFTYYGTRDFRVELDGYRTETIRRQLRPPWYELPPLDFIVETLWPFEIRDERIIDIELVPQELAPVDTILTRAESLRNQSRQGVPLVPNVGVAPPAGVPLQPPPVQLPPASPNFLPPGGVPIP
ncbi:PEGA domain-containing protein [Planctomycetaceae bacterium SH139]